jgi:hypothetical protein
MNIRKIAVVAGFAAGAAVAFAPLASADDLTTIVDSEISAENSLFTLEADLAGDSSAVIPASVSDPFETIPLTDAPQATDAAGLTNLDYELYGVNPIAAGIPSDPGSYEVFNGAVTKFDDAFNVGLYALENNGALIPSTDLFGNHIADALAGGTATDAFDYFYNFGIGDLSGFTGLDLSFLDIGSAI